MLTYTFTESELRSLIKDSYMIGFEDAGHHDFRASEFTTEALAKLAGAISGDDKAVNPADIIDKIVANTERFLNSLCIQKTCCCVRGSHSLTVLKAEQDSTASNYQTIQGVAERDGVWYYITGFRRKGDSFVFDTRWNQICLPSWVTDPQPDLRGQVIGTKLF